jgi:hypothetical protein
MRCQCGKLLRGSMRRCRPCALEFIRGIDTDFMSVVKQEIEEIMTEDSSSTTKRMSSPQKIAVAEWEAFQRSLRWNSFIRKACVVGIACVVVLCVYVAYRIGR